MVHYDELDLDTEIIVIFDPNEWWDIELEILMSLGDK